MANPEAERLAEQARLDRLKDAEERNRLGQFATPNALAVAIAGSHAPAPGRSASPVRFLDPSVGSGSFFSAIRQVFPARSIGPSVGVELDPAFADAAAGVWGPIGPGRDRRRLHPARSSGGRSARNLILANPPYVRHHHLGLEEKRRLQDRVGRRLG